MNDKKEIKISRKIAIIVGAITIFGAFFSMANFWYSSKSSPLSTRIGTVEAAQKNYNEETINVRNQLKQIQDSISGTSKNSINTRLSKIEGKLGI